MTPEDLAPNPPQWVQQLWGVFTDDQKLVDEWLSPAPDLEPVPDECYVADSITGIIGGCTTCSLDVDEDSARFCLGCNTLSCPGCSLGDLCPSCYFGFRSYRDEHDCLVTSTGDEDVTVDYDPLPSLELKSGTDMILTSGLRTASSMVEHGLKPLFIREALVADDHRNAQASLRRQLRPIDPKKVLLFEWCCSPTSRLGRAA